MQVAFEVAFSLSKVGSKNPLTISAFHGDGFVLMMGEPLVKGEASQKPKTLYRQLS